VIEVNPRVSRSSALASKATGYPIARMSAKIAIGKRLDELINPVTKKTTAAFEPALDYIVTKIPRWPFDKFTKAERTIGTQMKATGEVMAIDRSFEGSLQKAVRSLETDAKDLLWEESHWSTDDLLELIRRPNDLRLFAVMAALRRDVPAETIWELSKIDRWFLAKLVGLVELERELAASDDIHDDLLWRAKRAGFSDNQIGKLRGEPEESIRHQRDALGMWPVYKLVDTCAGEFASATPYYYSTYEEEDEAPALEGERALVVGSGPIRIGQGIEFDYCSVHSAKALHAAGLSSIIVNSNPETVSTDFDASDRLYFEPLDAESVHEILRHEQGENFERDMPPVIVQFGGQTAINLAGPLDKRGVKILGSGRDSIDLAEDRERFEAFLRGLGIPQPHGAAVTSLHDAQAVAERIGFPVLVRPSYVLGGRAMEVVYGQDHLARYIRNAAQMTPDHPVLVDKYLVGKEVEVDAICDGERVLIPGIMEHIERAGVHSGDSFAVYPGINLFPAEVETIVDYTTRIALAIGARGLINIQYVIHKGRIYVLEVNPRSSRTVPFLSKVTGVPMVKLATNIMLGRTLADQGYDGGLWPRQPLVAVKAPVFSMAKLRGVEVHLGPEMKSTGEVMGIDRSFDSAFFKALISAGLALPERGSILLSLADEDKNDSTEMVEQLVHLGYKLYATEGTAAWLERLNLPVQMATKRIGRGRPNVLDVILNGTVNGVINTPGPADKEILDGLEIRRAAVERGVPCITSIDTARAMLSAMSKRSASYTVEPLPSYRRKAFGY
jgi:carbamoyl-phosphate synthase large subunit